MVNTYSKSSVIVQVLIHHDADHPFNLPLVTKICSFIENIIKRRDLHIDHRPLKEDDTAAPCNVKQIIVLFMIFFQVDFFLKPS